MHSLRIPRLRGRWLFAAFFCCWIAVSAWQVVKPLPPGTNVRTAAVAIDPAAARLLTDLTYVDAHGKRRTQQQIFDEVMALIDSAQTFIVADFFLLNDSMGASTGVHRPLSTELADRLISRKRANPQLRVLLITDPVNEIYGGTRSPLLQRLQSNGIEVVCTDLARLRDSNPAYSALWRMFVQWWDNAPDSGVLPNPFGHRPSHVTLRSWLALLNFKANHRKIIVADDASGAVIGMAMSANPHDASSAHSNVALRIESSLALQMAQTELDVARFSGWRGYWQLPQPQTADAAVAKVTFLTEAAIRSHLLESIASTHRGDQVHMAMFYLSDRKVIASLLHAAQRGVEVRLILDPNKDAFGREKDGVPNRPVANELVHSSGGRIQVRWYQTNGEQFHTKLTLITHGERLIASLGSANLTRRNIGNYNLEANLAVELARDTALAQAMERYFATLWSNEGAQYTLPFEQFEDRSVTRYWRYRLMEATGLSTF